jgi:lipopolysaccharide/colanic/teichoic acid biosynthesis glycosyltransferase
MKNSNVNVKWKPFIDDVQRRVTRRKLKGIYSEGVFFQILQHERNRSDRLETNLSVVIYDFKNKSNIAKFLEVLKIEVRFTDHLGWTGKNSIGIILTGTDRKGAEKFIGHLHDNLNFVPPDPRITSYPEEWEKWKGGEADGKKINNVTKSTNNRQMMFVNGLPKWKRLLDITGSFLGLIILLPLFIVIALYIKIVSPGPVFFKQKRIGQGRKEFTFIKFRTMKHNNNETIHSHHSKDFINYDRPMEKLDSKDNRIIIGGRILRKSCIDELPQLINVLKGDMSLVGPRPCIPYEADEYERWHCRRFSIVPGLTGLWQVSGKNKLTFRQMIKLDITYEKKLSLWMDLYIILKTFPTVFGLIFESILKKVKINDNVTNTVKDQLVKIEKIPDAEKYSCNLDGDNPFAVTE